MRLSTLALLCSLAPSLSGCILGRAVGTAIDVTAAAATGAVKVTGAVIETTVDAVTPDSDDEDQKHQVVDETAGGSPSYEGDGNTERIDRPQR